MTKTIVRFSGGSNIENYILLSLLLPPDTNIMFDIVGIQDNIYIFQYYVTSKVLNIVIQ